MKVLRNQNPDEGGSVFDEPTEPSGQTEPQTPPAESNEPEGEPGDAGAPAEPSSASPLTPEAIAQAIRDAGIGQPAAAAEPQKRQYTQEEFEKAFNVFKPTKAIVDALKSENPEDVLAALDTLSSGVNKQAVTLASYMVQQAKEQIMEQLAPIQTQLQRQQEQVLEQEFFTSNSELKPYESLVRAVVDQMKQSGFQAKDKKSAFAEIGKRTREMLKQVGVTTTAKQQPPNQPGNMPRLPSGGQGGTGGRSANKSANKPAGMEIFE